MFLEIQASFLGTLQKFERNHYGRITGARNTGNFAETAKKPNIDKIYKELAAEGSKWEAIKNILMKLMAKFKTRGVFIT